MCGHDQQRTFRLTLTAAASARNIRLIVETIRVFLRFRFGDRKEILRDRLEEFERPFSIDVISGHYILRDRWKNLRDRFGPSKHLKKTLETIIASHTGISDRVEHNAEGMPPHQGFTLLTCVEFA